MSRYILSAEGLVTGRPCKAVGYRPLHSPGTHGSTTKIIRYVRDQLDGIGGVPWGPIGQTVASHPVGPAGPRFRSRAMRPRAPIMAITSGTPVCVPTALVTARPITGGSD